MDTISQFFGQPGQPVPPVDPDDLKIVYEFLQEFASQNPGGKAAVCVDVFKNQCKPNADMSAVTYRATMLGLLLKHAPDAWYPEPRAQSLKPQSDDARLNPALYREFAQLPMEWIGVGIERNGFPFDAELLLRRLRDNS